ncbi:MAG: hypothetical protein AAFS06_06255 [Cyanobacteria bacterium J06631_12]
MNKPHTFVRRTSKAIIWVALGLLCACNSTPIPQNASTEDNTTSQTPPLSLCPPRPEALPVETTQKEIDKRTYVFGRFDYAPRKILLQENTIHFQAREYDFVHCLTDGTWTVQPGTLGDEWIVARSAKFTDRPDFSNLEVDGETYQYRVVRTPHPPTNAAYKSVVLELLIPGEETPQEHTLYTLEDLQQASGSSDMGPANKLGIPHITTAIFHRDRLWWTVAFEQGEGNGGIATIISYDPATREIILIQPDELWSQQILNLAFTGSPEQPTLWMGTKRSSKGTSDVPAAGLVSYQPASLAELDTGRVQSYTPYNSPLIGAIPTQLAVSGEQLWVGTRNGVCALGWQAPTVSASWDCWQFVTKAIASPNAQSMQSIPVYPSRLSQTPAAAIPVTPNQEIADVLWWMLADSSSQQGRYEVSLEQGLEAAIEQGASPMSGPQWVETPGQVPMFWPGYWWHWQGDRFVRPLDHHLNNWIAGDRGIGPHQQTTSINDWYAMRGELELLELSAESTRVKHYSGWVDDTLLLPFPAVVDPPGGPSQSPEPTPNPLIEFNRQIKAETE